MAHKGIREFTGEELSGVALGQNGFKIISGAEVECGVTSGYENIKYFVALKAIDVDTEVEARSIAAGDDLTTNSGVYDGSSPITVLQGDIIYGAFNRVEVASASHYVIAYIGR